MASGLGGSDLSTEIKEPGSVRERAWLTGYIVYICTYVCVNSRSMEQLLSEKRELCFCEGTCGTMYKVSDTGSLMHLIWVRSCSS